jgi:hypothetical protein
MTDKKQPGNIKIEIVDEITKEFQLYSIYGVMHQKEGAYYKPLTDDFVKKLVIQVCRNRLPKNLLTRNNINEIMFFLGGGLIKEESVNPENRFLFQNGELVLENGKVTLQPQSDSVFTFQSKLHADLTADTSEIDKFLNDILASENDKRQILESLACGMWPALRYDCNFDSFTLCFGHGSNGKSILLSNIVTPVFADTVGFLSYERIHDRFSLSNLVGKRLNIATENQASYIKESDAIKSITSGDGYTVERKHKPAVFVKLLCSMFFAINKEPSIGDISHAMKRRLRLIHFPNTFSDNPKGNEKKSDPTLKNVNNPKIERMQKGLVVLLVQTAERLCHDGKMTANDQNMIAELQEASCHHRQFITENFIFDNGSELDSKDIFDAYINYGSELLYCERKQNGTPHFIDPSSFDKCSRNTTQLTKKLLQLYSSIITTKKSTGGKRMLVGLKPMDETKLKSNATTASIDQVAQVANENNLVSNYMPAKTELILQTFDGKII